MNALRDYASVGGISGAPKVVTSTESGGVVVVSTSLPASVNGSSFLSTTTRNGVSYQHKIFLSIKKGYEIVANRDV